MNRLIIKLLCLNFRQYRIQRRTVKKTNKIERELNPDE